MSKKKRGKARPAQLAATAAGSSEGGVLSKTQKRKMQKKRAAERKTKERQAAPKASSSSDRKTAHSAASLAVVYEDEHLIAINKPAGLLCHPSPGFWDHGTVVHALGARQQIPGFSEVSEKMLAARQSHTGEADSFIPRCIVHRLDRGTTGVMLIAKSEIAEAQLTEHFKQRTTSKTYIALLSGRPRDTAAAGYTQISALESGDGWRIEAPIGPDRTRPGRMEVAAGGKPATTVLRVHAHCHTQSLELCLVSVELLTGRQHQIRVHCSQCLGAPLANDDMYGGPRVEGVAKKRPLLHAWSMAVPHPATKDGTSTSMVHARAPLPEDMRLLVSRHFPLLDADDPSGWPRLPPLQ